MTEQDKKDLAQWKKDGYSDETIAFLLKGSRGVKQVCEWATYTQVHKVANALR
jgi:hypothetical protein